MTHPTRGATAPAILHPELLPSVDRGNGASTTPLVTYALGATAFLNGITSFEPGAAIGHHAHNCVESVLVVEGSAVVDIDGVETPLAAGDVTFVPGNVPHHFRNASDTARMRIFWTYASVDATRTLVATGGTSRVDAEQSSNDAPALAAVTELVDLDVLPGSEAAFLDAVRVAAELFQRAPGCRSFELFAHQEIANRYQLLVEWTTLEDHTVGFRGGEDFARWRELVMPHLSAPPRAGHLRRIAKGF